ncbi:MAG: FecR domain-containing protein [Verrucomicrobia bacterium]|nr:FecR domain-containing protein [Verrucomicrobiota bacterium]
MKCTNGVGNGLVGLGAVVVLAIGASMLKATIDHQGFARVNFVKGSPMYAKAGGAWTVAERDMALPPGYVVRTDANSRVELALGYNNGVIALSPNSEMALDSLTYQYVGLHVVHETQLSLRAGRMFSQVNKLAPGSKYGVKTLRGVAAIGGGRYAISADGDVQVAKGTAVLTPSVPDGLNNAITLHEGKTLNVVDPGTPQVQDMTPQQTKEVQDTVAGAVGNNDATSFKPATGRGNMGGQDPVVLAPLPPQPLDATPTGGAPSK